MTLSIEPLEPVTDEDVLIVYGFHQARAYPEFNRNNVYTLHGVAAFGRLNGRRPARVFHTGLGLSREADRLRNELARMEALFGTKVHHVNELYMHDEVASEA
ncbi:hypothetical protein KGG73_gp49 [Streptomyces phage Sentinel]|uniref:Uncharacterized protein n=1 Tax=Streptomyces phage Sentinel TaxID=2767584 RepID=A0A873WHN4_9CAUD|nr:hypothetical protein KGG73_gp49 [Streptomyces phage Sentinel]QPB09883.1 hypothetical protein CPT_Sentinel_049 [Streptomyces phage Sentinel]